MSRSFRKGRHPQNLYRAKHGAYCDHLSPIRNTGKVNRHLLQRLAQTRAMHVYDNERQAYCEFMHRHRLWNEPQREQAFKREARRCEEQTERKRDVAERIADWLEEQEEIRAEYEREMERLAYDLEDDRDWADWLEEQEEIRAEYEREMERLAADLYDDRDWRW